MVLAKYLNDSEDDIICDLAETYHILNYKELPPSLVATLVMGLPATSRLKRKITGVEITLDQMLMAVLVDDFNGFLWSRSKHRGKKPKSIFESLTEKKDPKDELMSFSSPEEFDEWMARKREKWACQK